MASLMAADPNALEKIIKPSADGVSGHYDVTLYNDPNKTGTLQPRTITVDDRLPQRNSPGMAPGLSSQQGMAPALIEKAYAEMREQEGGWQNARPENQGSGYAAANLGAAREGLEALTGHKADACSLGVQTPHAADDLWHDLEAATADRRPVTANIDDDPKNPGQHQALETAGLSTGHVYSLVGVSRDAQGNRQVTLRNPYQLSDSHYKQGEFTLSYDEFMKHWNGPGIINYGVGPNSSNTNPQFKYGT